MLKQFQKFICILEKYIKKFILFICLSLLWIYQKMLSPLKTPTCRFTPTCSAYAKEAFLLHGIKKGAILTLKRILRCHPWGSYGYDPVPLKQLTKKEKKDK